MFFCYQPSSSSPRCVVYLYNHNSWGRLCVNEKSFHLDTLNYDLLCGTAEIFERIWATYRYYLFSSFKWKREVISSWIYYTNSLRARVHTAKEGMLLWINIINHRINDLIMSKRSDENSSIENVSEKSFNWLFCRSLSDAVGEVKICQSADGCGTRQIINLESSVKKQFSHRRSCF